MAQIDLTQFIPAALSALGALISAVAAWLLYKTTTEINDYNKKAAARTYFASVIQTTNQTNAAVLLDDRNLEIMANLGKERSLDSTIQNRKEWLIFLWLNHLQVTYIGHIDGLLDKEFAENSLNKLLPILMADETAYRLVSTRGYDKRFIELCEQFRPAIRTTRS